MIFFYFYKTTNLINGRYYYGSGSKDNYFGSGKILKLALKKYGIENFKVEILKFFKSREEAFLFEEKFLRFFKISQDPLSYNLKNEGLGGDTFTNNPNKEIIRKKISDYHKTHGITYSKQCHLAATEAKKKYHPCYGSEIDLETKEKFRKKHSEKIKKHYELYESPLKGKKRSKEFGRIISEAIKGENHPNYGKHLSDQTKKRISDATRGKKVSLETREKMSKIFTGRKRSKEAVAKLSLTCKKKRMNGINDEIIKKVIDLYVIKLKSVKLISKEMNLKYSLIVSILKDNNINISKYRRDMEITREK